MSRVVLALALVILLAACGRSGYADIPLERESTLATTLQQRKYSVPSDARVLLELTPESYRHAIGPAGAFAYEPYELHVRCNGLVQVQESREYRRWLRPQAEGVGRQADCERPMRPGFQGKPSIGDTIYVAVIHASGNDWSILVVADDA